MKQLNFKDKCRVAAGWFLVKTGQLSHDDFTEEELNALIAPYFPQTLEVDVPAGSATLVCEESELSMPISTNRLTLSLLTRFQVVVLGNPLYRAHVIATLSALPDYQAEDKRLDIVDIKLDQLSLVHDEYSLVKDASFLLQQLPPVSLANVLTSPLKRVINKVTGGFSDSAINYLQAFTKGNKQRLLEDHSPAIEKALLNKLAELDLSVSMSEQVWREYLFRLLGQKVTVEDHRLRFWLS